MCLAKMLGLGGNTPKVVAPAPAPAPAEASAGVAQAAPTAADNSASLTDRARRGRSSLRIDLNSSGSTGSGLQIPQ